MLWRSNEGKDTDNSRRETPVSAEAEEQAPVTPSSREEDSKAPEESKTPESAAELTREEFIAGNEDAKKIYDDLLDLRKSLDALKENGVQGSFYESEDNVVIEETDEIREARQAIIDQARKDAEEKRRRRQESVKKAEEARRKEQEVIQAQQKAVLVAQEAERKRREAAEAAIRAKEIERKHLLEKMEAETKAVEERLREELEEKLSEKEPAGSAPAPEEEPALSDEEAARALEEAKEALLSVHEEQEEALAGTSEAAKAVTEDLALRQKKQAAILRRERKARAAEAEAAKAAERKKRKEEIKARREERRRQRRKEAEIARQKKRNKAAAELGGGIVNVKGVTIQTEINELPSFSWRDFFGFKDRKERKAETDKEKEALRQERERRREEARAIVDLTAQKRIENYRNSKFGRKMDAFKAFCERHKVVLLTSFSIVLLSIVGVAGVFNYYTAFAYSYNGQTLGVVKEKDDVLRITDLVQGALTEERDVDVVIDARRDIEFTRVSTIGDVPIDTSEEVLKNLTYMGDVNVEAFGIYVDGKKVGAVDSKDTAAAVLQDIRDMYTHEDEGAEVEEAVFVEDVDIRKSNTDLEDVLSEEEMVNVLSTSGEKESVHKVVAGETLADIAKLYSMKEEDILDDNSNVDPSRLKVGSALVIKQTAPLVTLRVTEKITYEETVEYQTVNQNDDSIYEGDTQTRQTGENGVNEVTARVVSVNGETIEETDLVTKVKKEPVDEIILVGTKERPPTVGSGKYIWPLSGGYRVSSGFGARWGRTHYGLDLACDVGSNVMAADGGTVTYAGYSGSYGYVIMIDHQNGMETRYAHNSKLLVSEGDKVYQGQHIAESGNTGRSTGPHLHFEIRVGGDARNPLNYLP